MNPTILLALLFRCLSTLENCRGNTTQIDEIRLRLIKDLEEATHGKH